MKCGLFIEVVARPGLTLYEIDLPWTMDPLFISENLELINRLTKLSP